MIKILLARLSDLWSYLGQPDGGLNRFDLAEEWPNAAVVVMTPVLEKTSSFRCNSPLGQRELTPPINLLAHSIDDGSMDILLILGRKIVEQQVVLFGSALLVSRPGDGCDELSRTPALDNLLCRLPAVIQLPMARRIFIRRVENRMVEERIGHLFNS